MQGLRVCSLIIATAFLGKTRDRKKRNARRNIFWVVLYKFRVIIQVACLTSREPHLFPHKCRSSPYPEEKLMLLFFAQS